MQQVYRVACNDVAVSRAKQVAVVPGDKLDPSKLRQGMRALGLDTAEFGTGIADALRGRAGRGFRGSPGQAKLAVLGFGSLLAFGGAMAVSGVQTIAGPYRCWDSDASSGPTMWHPPKIAARTSEPWASSAVWSIRWQLVSRLQ